MAASGRAAALQEGDMTPTTADVVICGAGISGIAAAYHLTVKQRLSNVVLVDERPPLTLTSDKSTECYRNWWPGPGDAMVRLMNRSIDLLEALAAESGNYYHMNRRGYVFLTANAQRASAFKETAATISALGAGPVRLHAGRSAVSAYQPAPASGYTDQPTGADLLLDAALIQQHFPFVASDTVAVLHTRRCGWLSAQQLGMYLLEQAKARGVTVIRGRLTEVMLEHGRVAGVRVQQGRGTAPIQTRTFVNAAGPLLKQVGHLLGVDVPVFNELHGKVIFEDTLGVVPREAPLMIWSDPVTLPWSAEERQSLAENDATRWLLDKMPAGVHFRPEGGPHSRILLLLWTYHLEPQEPVWPPRFAPEYAEVVLRGMTRMIPGLAVYLERWHRPVVDGGYYCKTRENRPLIGPLPVDGAYILGALSGFGIMASMAAGELLAAHVTGSALPEYAAAFVLSRYDDAAYQQLMASWDATAGQL
jgi:glycine/D-amino acid oxidase-like deaminating enzyme